jgi:prevent-host-death family protein
MHVGVRQLKARLSEYVERAARGETITVTNRGRPKAILAPVPVRDRLDEGIAQGWVRPPKRHGLRPIRRRPPVQPTLDVLADDRGR